MVSPFLTRGVVWLLCFIRSATLYTLENIVALLQQVLKLSFVSNKSGLADCQEENRRSTAESNVDKLQKETERYKGSH